MTEYNILRLLENSPEGNTMKVFDGGLLFSRIFFIAMELFTGPTLKASLQKHRFNGNQIQDLASDILHTLTSLHSKNFVHRDIHPGNIVYHDGHWRVIDYGEASKEDERRWITRSADLKAFAGLLFEASTGKPLPFTVTWDDTIFKDTDISPNTRNLIRESFNGRKSAAEILRMAGELSKKDWKFKPG